jgi:hypothetical protein
MNADYVDVEVRGSAEVADAVKYMGNACSNLVLCAYLYERRAQDSDLSDHQSWGCLFECVYLRSVVSDFVAHKWLVDQERNLCEAKLAHAAIARATGETA